MRVGQIGYGRWGQVLARALDAYPETDLVGIHTRRDLQGERYVASVDDLLERVRPDAVVVAAPLAARPLLIRQALEAGVHVLAEKPLAPDASQARELQTLATSRGLALHVNYVYAHSAAVRLLVDRFAGEKPKAIRITLGQPGQLYTEEGVDTLLLSHGLAIGAQLPGLGRVEWELDYRTFDKNELTLAMSIRSGPHSIYTDLSYPEKFRRIEVVLNERTLVADLVHPGRLLAGSLCTSGIVDVMEEEVDQSKSLDQVFFQFVRACEGLVKDNSEIAAWIDGVLAKWQF